MAERKSKVFLVATGLEEARDYAELRDLFAQLKYAADVRAVVIAGAGEPGDEDGHPGEQRRHEDEQDDEDLDRHPDAGVAGKIAHVPGAEDLAHQQRRQSERGAHHVGRELAGEERAIAEERAAKRLPCDTVPGLTLRVSSAII